jgi:hypothetical protein
VDTSIQSKTIIEDLVVVIGDLAANATNKWRSSQQHKQGQRESHQSR